jgi:hypothetical protein
MSAKLPDDPAGLGPADPRLTGLLSALTADPAPGELAGESAALAMFREHARPEAARLAPRGTMRRPGGGPRAPWLAAAAVVVIGGFGGAAYAAVLPAPVQHVAFRVLGFAGVSDSRHHGGQRAAARPPGRARPPASPGTSRASQPPAGSSSPPARSGSPATGRPRASGSARPPVSGPVRLSLTAAGPQIAAGGSEEFTGRLAGSAGGRAGIPVSLVERAAGQPGWHLAASARTQSDGSVVLTVSSLSTNAVFRLIGPHRSRSAPVRVIVVPAVSVSIVSGPAGRAARLTVSAPLAAPGDPVVLQVRYGAGWLSVKEHRLRGDGQARFGVRRRTQDLTYRVVLPATRTHGRSVSSPVLDPAR